MKKYFKFISFSIVLAMVALTVASCASTGGKLAKIQEAGEMVVYTTPNFPPFEFPGVNGIEGVDIEVANAIAEELGVASKVEEAEFDSIISALKGGKGDIAIAGFTITDERKKSVDFSDPYIKSYQYLIVAEGSEIAVMEDLAGKNVGVALGYTGNFVIEYEIGEEGVLAGTNTTMREYKNAMEATLDLIAGRIDAVVMDEFVAKTITAQNSGIVAKQLTYKDGSLVEEEYGVAVPKDNSDLLEKINSVIKRLKDEGKIEEWLVQFSEKLANE